MRVTSEPKRFKRGDRVIIRTMYGKVINTTGDSDDGVRVSVEGMKPAWWAVVPARYVEKINGSR